MNKTEFVSFVEEFYTVKYDCPFENDLETYVFRHSDNKKWFAILMRIPRKRIISNTEGYVDVVNLKCAPEIIDDVWRESGVFPAYHMNKKHWITLALDSSCADETVKWLLQISYDLTKRKIKRKK